MTSKRARSSPVLIADLPLLESFKTHGWVCIPNLLSRSELRVLQTECTALYARESVESIIAQGCVLDILAQCPMRDSDAARTDANIYLKTRAKQLKSINDPHGVFASLLFKKLPTIARQLMATEDVFFFNEHYVVKPPRSHVEFRWHRDDDEQLAMCVHRESIRPYVSAWCALDDVTKVNGALQFVSLDTLPESEEEDVENLKTHASEPVTVNQGDVLFFLSNVWHCSSSNGSETARRAFYAQYSGEKISAGPNDSSPLSFAISPWTVKSDDGFAKKVKR
ncbi:hypothetical protein DVH05_010407 [Phytophthora capsici]|nr:hypothetical protein DVH05_010407 [Phytophthora capsici]|eukprot:jgi/Phyca11/100194/e_gw1.4.903.1